MITAMITGRVRVLCSCLVLFSPLFAAAGQLPERCGSSVSESAATKRFLKKDFVCAREIGARLARAPRPSNDELAIYGWSEFMLDNYLQADGAFRRIARDDQRNFDALLGMAWVSIKLLRLDEAAPLLEQALRNAESWQRWMVADARGWLALKKYDYPEAEKRFLAEDGLIEADDLKSDPMVGLGWMHLNKGDIAKARQFFRRGLERDDHCFFCNDGLARAAFAEGKLDEALQQTLAGLGTVGSNNGLATLLASVLGAIGDGERSVRAYQALIAKHPRNAPFQASLGHVWLARGDAAKARQHFEAALKIEPGLALAQAGIAELQFHKTLSVKEGWAAYHKADYEGALAAFDAKRVQGTADRNPAAEDGRGWTLLALGKPGAARDAFRAAIALDAEFFYSRNGLVLAEGQLLAGYTDAWVLLDLGRFEEAAGAFGRMRSATPADLQWLIDDGLAWAAFYRNEHAKAQAAFEAILARNPHAFLSKKGLALIALERKDFDAAAKHLIASFTDNPYQILRSYSEPASRLLAAGRHREAKEILDLGWRVYPLSADIMFLHARALAGLKAETEAADKLVAAARAAPAYIDPVFDQVQLPRRLLREAYLALGWGLYYAGAFDKALARFDQYADSGGTSEDLHTGRGWALLGQKKHRDAVAQFRKALEGVKAADAQSGIGWGMLAAGELQQAGDAFRGALKLAPGTVAAQTGLAEIQYRKTFIVKEGWEAYFKGDYAEALKRFEAKREQAARAKNPAAEDGRGWALLALGRAKDAAAAFEKAIAADAAFFYSHSGLIAAKRSGLARYNTAWDELEAGRFAQARATFSAAAAEIPAELQWLVEDGRAWLALYEKDIAGAERKFRSVLEKTPDAYLSTKGLAFVALERKQYELALKTLVKSVTQAPYQILTTYTIPALRLIEAHEAKLALEVLRLGERAYPYSADIKFLQARAFKRLNDESSAARSALAAVALAPGYIEPALDALKLSGAAQHKVLHALAWGLYFTGDNAAAGKRFQQYLKAGGDDPNARRGLSFALFRLGKITEAVPLLEQAMAHEPKLLLPILEQVAIPDVPGGWLIEYSAGSTLGWAHLRLGDASRAAQQFRRVLEQHPFWIDALSGLGHALAAAKDREGARQAFAQALQIQPLYPDARRGLDALGR